MPMAIVLVMGALSFSQLKSIGWKPILVFLTGSAVVSLFPILLIYICSSVFPDLYHTIIDEDYWTGLVTLVGSWIGGSTSQLILKEVSDCSEQIFLAILLMDNVLVNIWTIIMFQIIQKSEALNQHFMINDEVTDMIPDHMETSSTRSAIFSVVLCIVIVVIAEFLLFSFLLKIVLLSIVGLLLGNFVKQWSHTGVIKAGGYMIILIMAILGLKLNFSNFEVPLAVIVFCIIWLCSHYIGMFLMTLLLKINMAWVPIASMANVGGISTAPAVTKAYNEEWMPHAIILAILSMVTGTYWGLLTIFLIQNIF